MRYQVLSPDGLRIAPCTYPDEASAWRALARWCLGFAVQGYYAGVEERIALADLPRRCTVAPAISLARSRKDGPSCV